MSASEIWGLGLAVAVRDALRARERICREAAATSRSGTGV
jgi:hypothetical protein